tara:strand:+ start:887 stop:2236 length:1350 start_codon:yes stop_codon:yes gene_type:complete
MFGQEIINNKNIMSYRNPRYIDTSVQGSFDKLQNTINSNVATMAKNQKAEELKRTNEQNARVLAGANQSQATINDLASNNTVGNETTTGLVDQYFEGYPARAAEIAMELAKTPKPENYSELQLELTNINNAPEDMKQLLENSGSQLNIKDFSDIDRNQNSDALLAAQILQGEPGFEKGNGFGYKFVPGKAGSIDIVFEGKGYIPPTKKGEEPNPDHLVNFKEPYILNSQRLKAMQENDQSLIVRTPKMSTKIDNALKATSLINGAKYDDATGTYMGGGVLNLSILGEPIEQNFGSKEKPNMLNVASINRAAVEQGLDNQIKLQIASFMDPDYGDDGQARSVWNMRISEGAAFFDEDLAREAFGLQEKDDEGNYKTPITDKHKKDWADATQPWNYKDELSDEQVAVFNVMYKKFIVDDVMETLNSPQYLQQRLSQISTQEKEVTPNGPLH